MVDRLCPTTSCRSRAIRRRSSAARSRRCTRPISIWWRRVLIATPNATATASQTTAAAALPEFQPSATVAARASSTAPASASGSHAAARREAITGRSVTSGAMWIGPPG